MWIINPEIFPGGTHDTVFLPGCFSFTNYGGCRHPSGERIIWFHRQLRITCKCHLAERFLHGSKDTLQWLAMIAKPFISIKITAKPQNPLNWISTTVVWESFRHSFQVSRLFAIQLFYWCACYITATSHRVSKNPRLLKIFHPVLKANRREWMNTLLLTLTSRVNVRMRGSVINRVLHLWALEVGSTVSGSCYI